VEEDMIIKGVVDKISVYNQNKVEQDKLTSLKKNNESSKSTYSSDKVELSAQGKLLNELTGIVNQQSEVRKDKVEYLKQKINSGEYQISSKEIAKKMVENEIDLYL
jgi:negative regulator of flagellin synthesis FlgM